MQSSVTVPPQLPARAALTSAEKPWPLRLLSAKMEEYINKMSHVWVEGEIIQYSPRPGVKTQFITVKDIEADVSTTVSIMTHLIPATLSPGDKVVIYAKPSYYGKRGTLNLWAQEIRPVGFGDILARIEALKNRLATEGLFDASRKKPLPFLPRRIGLIAGRNAEGTRDVLVNTRKRWPSADFDVREVAVQGEHAVTEIIAALNALDGLAQVDVIVIARGGGSLEDLLPFSDERLIRAAADTHTPIVSAIGHERDTPLLDFVADVRASTPTDAARRIVPDVTEELSRIHEASLRATAALERHITREHNMLSNMLTRPCLANPQSIVDIRRDDLTSLHTWMNTHVNHIVERKKADLLSSLTTLRALSPLSTLERGYSILLDESGRVISDPATTHAGDTLEAVMAGGRLPLTIAEGGNNGTEK